VFSLLSVALPATIFAVSQGAAQTPAETERREERLERREERREEERQREEERREERRDARSVDEPATTGSAVRPVEEEGRTYHGGPKQDD
jgi:hypothetical protein